MQNKMNWKNSGLNDDLLSVTRTRGMIIGSKSYRKVNGSKINANLPNI